MVFYVISVLNRIASKYGVRGKVFRLMYFSYTQTCFREQLGTLIPIILLVFLSVSALRHTSHPDLIQCCMYLHIQCRCFVI